MSRKPYIKIVYPDASEIAMLLTEAMVRRASGKRVVETESSERESAGQDLFAGTLCCVTETSVELTLNLAPEAMDFALATLIAKNLTQSERDKAMAASDSLELDALFSPRAGEAAGAGTCTDEVGTLREPTKGCPADAETEEEMRKNIQAIIANTIHDHFETLTETLPDGTPSFTEDLVRRITLHIKLSGLLAAKQSEKQEEKIEQEKQIEVGKIPDKTLREILVKMLINHETSDPDSTEPIDIAINEMNYAAGVIDLQETYEPETDQNLTRLLAVLLYAAPDPDWDRDDISNFADMVFSTVDSIHEKFIDIGTLCELMTESEYIATEMKSDATTHGILERLEKQEGEHAKHKPEKADARRQIAQALAALIYWVPRNLNNKKQRDSIQMACIYLWRCMEKYPAATILAREIANSLNHIATEVDNGYKPSDIYNCIEREITGCWAGAIPEFEKEKILVFPDVQDKSEDNKSNDPSDTADEGELGLGEESEGSEE